MFSSDVRPAAHTWPTRESFLRNPALSLMGYQVRFERLETGLFLFDHRECGTTMTLKVYHFAGLYEGPLLATRATGTEACPEYCLREEELRPCDTPCECAYVREVMQIIINWKKHCRGIS